MENSANIVDLLQKHADDIRERFGVTELRLFGSVARGEADATSDVDILVRFRRRATFDGYMDLKFYLETS